MKKNKPTQVPEFEDFLKKFETKRYFEKRTAEQGTEKRKLVEFRISYDKVRENSHFVKLGLEYRKQKEIREIAGGTKRKNARSSNRKEGKIVVFESRQEKYSLN